MKGDKQWISPLTVHLYDSTRFGSPVIDWQFFFPFVCPCIYGTDELKQNLLRNSIYATLTPIVHLVSDGMFGLQSSRAHSALISTPAAAHSMWQNSAANTHRSPACTHVLSFRFSAPSCRHNLNQRVQQIHVSHLICESVERPGAGLFHSLEIQKKRKVATAINSEAPPVLPFSLPLPSVRTNLVRQRLCSLTFSTHVGLISPQNCNSSPGRAAVRSRAPSLWPSLHNTWNPIKAMKSNQRRLHLVMLIFHSPAIKSNSSPKLFIYLFPSRACSVALYIHPPLLTPSSPEDLIVESHLAKL